MRRLQEALRLLKESKLDLLALADELRRASKTIESADVDGSSLDVRTARGDVVRFNAHDGKLYALVQGQKNDIDVGEIGSTSYDVLHFLRGLKKSWYREYDEHFDE